MKDTQSVDAGAVDLQRFVGRGNFRLADGTECRNAYKDGANITFEYKNVFGWQQASMPPWTECQSSNGRTEARASSALPPVSG